MQRHGAYYSQTAPSTHRYSSTSSAFSPSANPNEDWTKISDLAERRRIQNRIAQRNYRKKLKKRLEDLERRAASNSASPEQKPAELNRSTSQHSSDGSAPEAAAESIERPNHPRRSPAAARTQYLPVADERTVYSTQYARPGSTSPPLFSYSAYPVADAAPWGQYTPLPAGQPIPTTTSDYASYPPYLPPLTSSYSTMLPSTALPPKPEYYVDDEFSPFTMSYASMAGIDIPVTQPYADSAPHTPPLSETFDFSSTDSQPDSSSSFPTPPASIPGTPPLF